MGTIFDFSCMVPNIAISIVCYMHVLICIYILCLISGIDHEPVGGFLMDLYINQKVINTILLCM